MDVTKDNLESLEDVATPGLYDSPFNASETSVSTALQCMRI